MEMMAPSEDAQKERFARIDERFVQIDKRFDRVEGDVKELRKDVGSVQTTLNRICIGLAMGFASTLLAILAKGG